MGLPRIVPPGGATVSGRFFNANTVLSVPSYTIHHNPQAFERPDEYWPERWLKGDQNELKKYFIPFSFGPRACVGRNVANMELVKVLATLLRRL
jgi:benzoate 4-monooxygenase